MGRRPRWLMCFDFPGRDLGHTRAVRFAAGKRRRAAESGQWGQSRRQYRRLAVEASVEVPAAVAQQIHLDIWRTFSALPQQTYDSWGWPEAAQEGAREAAL